MSWLKTPWSIQSVVRREEADWRAFNHYRKGFAFSRLDRQLLFASEHPIRFSLSLLALLLVVLALGDLLPPDWLTANWSTWKESEQLAYFTTLWAVQATLAALVYPIVIAFVTVFLQRRPGAEAFLQLYLLDSGALVAGLSCLALVVVMAFQYVLVPKYGTAALPAWSALDAVWFLLNSALTTRFLYRTVAFLRPEVQLNVVRRYVVNVALPRDVMRLNSFQVLAQAQTKGWIPAPGYGDDKAPDGPRVLLSKLTFREGEAQGTLSLKEPSRLFDVRLWPLRIVVAFWMRAAHAWPRPEGNHPRRLKEWPLLTVPLTPGMEYCDSIPLARVSAGPRLTAWQRMLLRLAFVFRPVRQERYGIQVKAIVEEFEADAREAASNANVPTFERSYEALLGLHKLWLGACLVKNDDGSVSSWALLPDIQGFFDQALYIGWANTYRSIFLAAIDAMAQDTRPVRRLCHLVQHLEGEELRASPVEIRENVLQLPPLMLFQLGGWWTHRVEEQGIMDHGHHRMVVLRPPLGRVYDEVLSSFVAGWENARIAVARVPDASASFEWPSGATISRLSATHVQETARMLLAAVARGDRSAAEWLADVLSKWWGGLDHEHESIALYGKTKFLTLEHVKLTWPQLSSSLGLTDKDIQWSGGRNEVLQRGVLVAALQNFWTDIRLLTVELLLSWAAQDEAETFDNSLAMEISAGLLAGTQWRGGGILSVPLSRFSAAGYLDAKVRQYAAEGEHRGGYIAVLSRFVERVKDMQRPDMIGSRVYSFFGADDVASLQEPQLALLAVLSASDWSVGESLRRQVDIWMPQHYESVEVLRNQMRDWLQRLDQAADLSPKVVSELLARTGKSHDAAVGRERAKRGIESLRDFVEARRAEVLESEPVDPARLKELARFSSSKGFSAVSGVFPLQLFGGIESTSAELQDFTMTMNQVRKGELTHVEIDQRAANEAEFWAETMARQVGAILLFDVLEGTQFHDVFVPDAEAYWLALRTEAARVIAQGYRPILILDNAARPEWVWQWQHADYDREYTRPEDLRVRRLEGRGDGYVCDFNDIEVYVAPLPPGQSILLARESFRSVAFTAFERGRCVDVSFSERSDSKHLVDLKLRFSRRVLIGDVHATRLQYVTQSNPAE